MKNSEHSKGINKTRRLLLSSAGVGAGLLLTNNGLPNFLRSSSELANLSYSQTIALLDNSYQ